MYNGGMTGASQTSIMAFQCYHFTPKLFCTVAWSIHLLQQNERKYSQMSTLQALIPTEVLITLSQSWCCLLKAFKLYKEQDKRFSHFSKKKKSWASSASTISVAFQSKGWKNTQSLSNYLFLIKKKNIKVTIEFLKNEL